MNNLQQQRNCNKKSKMQKTTQTKATHLLVLNANREKHNNCHNRNNKLCQTNQGNVLCSSNTLKQTTHFALSCCRVQHSPNNTTKQHYLHHKGRSTRIICKTKQCSAVAMRFLIATRNCGQNEIRKKGWVLM